MLDLHDAEALAAFVADHPTWRRPSSSTGATTPGVRHRSATSRWRGTTREPTWRDVAGTGATAHVLIAAGAPIDGLPGDRETPLITAASYGDADVAAVLIAAGADIDATAAADAGGVPGGSALLHAAVFGMTDVVDLLVAAGARVR